MLKRLSMAALAVLAWSVQAAIAAPVVSITAPAANSKYLPPATISVSANATDASSTIAQVDFYANGTTLIGTATTAPYAVTWSGIASGSYSITAKATNAANVSKTSTAVKVIVNTPPAIAIGTPAVGTNYTGLATIPVTADVTDPDGTITKVNFYHGGTLIGSATTAPYTATWANAPPGNYNLIAKATDNLGGVTTSGAVLVTVTNPITVAITAPATNTKYLPPATISLSANATDTNGTIAQVEFYTGTTLIGTATAAPYTVNWANVPTGKYPITAKATDSQGIVKTSSAVNVIVNTPPTVSLTAPATNASYVGLATIPMTADVADPDGTITKVGFYHGGTLIGTATTAPYTATWANAPPGTYNLTARGTDNLGGVVTSAAMPITVTNPVTVAMTAPANNAKYAPGTTISLAANASDTNGTITQVDFYAGTTLIGTATTAPYTFTWANVPTGKYPITAKATDSQGIVKTSSAVTILVDTAPTIALTAPAANASYSAPATIAITADVADPDGSIAKVQFYSGSTLLGTVTAAPYTFNWTNVAAGTYTLKARATDNLGAVTMSSPSVTVTVVANMLPTVTLTAPLNNASYTGPATIPLTANAADSDGTIAKVDFYNGATLLGTVTAAPYNVTWANVGAGNYSITAVATDNQGTATTSTPVTITVAAAVNTLPTVAITTPVNNQSFAAPASVVLNATASDTDGSVAKVEFYAGSTLLTTLSQAPYMYYWTNVAQGSYTLFAKATDNLGAVTTSAAVNITVAGNTAPTVSLNATPTTAAAPATIALNATASDADGTVAKVEFFNGNTLLTTVTQAPYVYSWTNVAAGNYTVTAKATDNAGAATVSAPVSVTVGSGAVQAYYIDNDQLGTPRVITNQNNQVVWQWDNSDPFGNNIPNADPGNTGTQMEFNLRYPGQYFDKETNLHYNYFRTYDPATGRYIESDPIGLRGGLNTYAYVEGNPISKVDPMGLQALPLPMPPITIPGIPDISREAQLDLAGRLDRLIDRVKNILNSDTSDLPSCKLIRRSPPGSTLNPGCTKCWRCDYSCGTKNVIGGGNFITRFQVGGCVEMNGPGYVPGFTSAAQCEAASAGGGNDPGPTVGGYR